MNTATIASLATAGGTLVLAVATFLSTRSANQAARISERSLQIGLRPVLFNARPQDPPQKVGFIDDRWFRLENGLAAVREIDGVVYLAAPLRNVGQGLAVLHGWHLWCGRPTSSLPLPALDDFRSLTRDLYIPAGDIGFWQGAIRDSGDPQLEPVVQAIREGSALGIDLLYGDHEGGQRTITRFALMPSRSADGEEATQWGWAVVQHWNVDRPQPR